MEFKKKCILLSIPIGMSARNILRSDVYKVLKERFNLAILTPLCKDRDFVKEFEDKNVEFYPFPELDRLRKILLKIWNRIQYYSFWIEFKTETIKKYIKRLRQEHPFGYLPIMATSYLFYVIKKLSGNKIPFLKTALNHSNYRNLRDRYNIDLVFTVTTDVLEDKVLMYQAKKEGLPLMSFVHSWDILPSRGYLATVPDRLLVWNELMARQAEKLHTIFEEKVKVVGIPQYDEYFKISNSLTKDDFLRFYGVSKDKKVITYTCSAERVFPDEPEFLKDLISELEKGVFGNTSLIIRLHPTERKDFYLKLFKDKPIIIDIPVSSFAATYVNWEGKEGKNSIEKFVCLMKFSDVVINHSSTVTIDAVLFDTPVVCIGYNLSLPQYRWNNAPEWYRSSHFKNIAKTGGVKIAYNKSQLIKYVNIYLKEPEIDREGRKAIIKEQCCRINGQVAVKVGREVENLFEQ